MVKHCDQINYIKNVKIFRSFYFNLKISLCLHKVFKHFDNKFEIQNIKESVY